MKKIAIVGGGTAGWMAALLLQKRHPEKDIMLIESSEIGILGAGEGTTPHFFDFLRDVDIAVEELIKNCGATFKLGISFENWSDTPQKYTHSFLNAPSLCLLDARWTHLVQDEISNKRNLDELNFNAKCISERKLPLIYGNYPDAKKSSEAYDELGVFGLHFNAQLLATELRKVAVSRGVKRIDTKVTGFIQDEQGNVIFIKTSDFDIPVDFVFDCTGFSRMIIGKLYNTPWNSYSDFLPMKSAIPFFIKHDDNIEPCTKAVAMKHGWVWQIPVQGRYGMGYVFDSDYITADQALQEVRQVYGENVESTREFKFSAGCFTETCVNNVVAAGISQGFVEPLEATSLWVTYLTIKDALDEKIIDTPSSEATDRININFRQRTDEIANFIYAHYLTNRKDSLFWTEFEKKNKPPEKFQQFVDEIRKDVTLADSSLTFGAYSWMLVLQGIGKKINIPSNNQALTSVTKNMFVENQARILQQCLPHDQVLRDFGAKLSSFN
jgi:tryptophan halogenase